MKLTLEQCRHILAERAEGMTDEEVMQLRDALYAFANTLIDKFLSKESEAGSVPHS